MDEDLGKVLCIAPDCDPTALHMDPAEGYLLSRIDGQTPWRILREMGAMPAEEADLCLESWLARGLVVVDADRSEREGARRRQHEERDRQQQREAAVAAEALPEKVDESEIDESLDVDVSVQRRILEFEVALGRPYHEILGIEKDADAKQIKRAYFRLSKEFHPDRYFRRQIGGYAQRLDRIFKKLTEAHELLSDPATRAEIERSMQTAAASHTEAKGGAATGAEAEATPGGPAAPGSPRPLSKLERLRQRMPFRIPERLQAERRHKAQSFFHEAQRSIARGAFSEAAASVRLAIAFDPFNAEYRGAFGEIQARAAEQRARALLEETGALEASQLKEALRLLEDVLLYRPHDPEVNQRAAAVALELDKDDLALEYAQRAAEHSPEVALYHRTLGRVHAARGQRAEAIQELERALKLDPADHEARRLLTSWRGSRPAL